MLHYALHKALQFNGLPGPCGPWVLLMISSAQSTGTDIACKGRQALIRQALVFRQLNKLPSAVVLLAHQSNAKRSPRTWPMSQGDELCTAPGENWMISGDQRQWAATIYLWSMLMYSIFPVERCYTPFTLTWIFHVCHSDSRLHSFKFPHSCFGLILILYRKKTVCVWKEGLFCFCITTLTK